MIDFAVWGSAAATTLAAISVFLAACLIVALPFMASNLIVMIGTKLLGHQPEKRKRKHTTEKPKRLALGDDGELLLDDGE